MLEKDKAGDKASGILREGYLAPAQPILLWVWLECTIRWLFRSKQTIAILALILSVWSLYREFFYEKEALSFSFIYVDMIYEPTPDYSKRRVGLRVTFSLANSGTTPVILSSMCLGMQKKAFISDKNDPSKGIWTAFPLAGTNSAGKISSIWLETRDGSLPGEGKVAEPILLKPGELVQRHVYFNLLIYADGELGNQSDDTWRHPAVVHLDLIDSSGNPISTEFWSDIWLNEGRKGYGYSWKRRSTAVLPLPRGTPMISGTDCVPTYKTRYAN